MLEEPSTIFCDSRQKEQADLQKKKKEKEKKGFVESSWRETL